MDPFFKTAAFHTGKVIPARASSNLGYGDYIGSHSDGIPPHAWNYHRRSVSVGTQAASPHNDPTARASSDLERDVLDQSEQTARYTSARSRSPFEVDARTSTKVNHWLEGSSGGHPERPASATTSSGPPSTVTSNKDAWLNFYRVELKDGKAVPCDPSRSLTPSNRRGSIVGSWKTRASI